MAGEVEELIPTSDVTSPSDWTSTGANYYGEIDEGYATPNDTDYIECPRDGGPTSHSYGGLMEMHVGNPSKGLPIVRITCKFRHQVQSVGDLLSVRLIEGVSIRKSNSWSGSTSWTNRSLDYAQSVLDAIVDWTDLRIRFEWASTSDWTRVSVAGFEIEYADGTGELLTMGIGN